MVAYMRVLVVADQPDPYQLARSHLKRRGLVVDHAATQGEALGMIAATRYDVILLDPMPVDDGARLVGHLRRGGDAVPVIVLSATATAADRIGLLEAGADDCLGKPFDLDELVARIKAVSRRGRPEDEQPVVLGNLCFHPGRRAVVIDGRPIVLRPRELTLIETLLRGSGQPVHRDQLMSNLYSADAAIGSNSLDVHVHHLRQRLAAAGANVSIATIRGLGYALQAPAD